MKTQTHYYDPGLISDLCTHGSSNRDDRLVIEIGHGDVVTVRMYGTAQFTRRGKVTAITIEWED